MPRIKVAVPDQFLFSIEHTVGLSDVNYAKHLDSVSMVNILHEARLQFLASLGFTESNIFGLGMVVTDLAVDYRSESFANDRLIIDVGVSTFNRYGFDIGMQITNSALETIVCNAKIGVVFFDFDQHEITPIPVAFKTMLGHPEIQEVQEVQVA
ncbi:MAG: thioesterase family protein [Gammaproteobacteria bacterium]|nr:thioesterase family protein [Gammaproteobacteria bacterium]MDD9895194.1 thioesterase family protein [Gammaproteobacteria bacterium]MDD9958358.1 thioesterase family protein [Gammaproteobacteria bacterium]